ncbi:MAG: peptidoglycan-binding protein [Brevefilum sp.]
MKKQALWVVLSLALCLLLTSCASVADEGKTAPVDLIPLVVNEPTEMSSRPIGALTPSSTTITLPGAESPTEVPNPTITQIPLEVTETHQISAIEQYLILEQQLQALGFVETGLVDGVVDQQTALAIAHLEWLNGMPITGEVTDALLALIRSSDVKGVTKPPPYPARALSRYLPGGIAVGFLSGRLVDLGCLDATDSSFNPYSFNALTENAVRQFQQLNGLPTNGVVDYKNWAALFHPAAIPSDGQSPLAPFDEYDWATDFYPLLDNPIDVVFDGQYLWVLHSSGDDAFDNLLVRIDPKAGLLAQYPPVMFGDIDAWENRTSQMLFDGNRLYLLMPRNETRPPQIVILIPATAEKFIHTTINDASDAFPAEALGFDGNKIWVTDHHSAWAINRNTGKAYNSYLVGWGTTGEMAFDGKCMWMASDVGLASFHTGGDYACPGANMAYSLPAGPVVFDGRRIWTAGWDAVYWLDAKSGTIGDAIPVGSAPSALAFDGKTIWVANQGDDMVMGIDAATGSVGPALPTGNQPVALVHDGRDLWVVNAGDRTLQRIEVHNYHIEIIQPTATPIPSPTATFVPTNTPTLPPLTRSLRLASPYMRGDDVRLLQQRLLDLGFEDIGWADSTFGPKTDQAVRQFQALNGLTVDGIVGPMTWERLFSGEAKRP